MSKPEHEIIQADRERAALDHALSVLARIATYSTPEALQEASESEYGLEPSEAIEMAYENVIWEAEAALNYIRSLNIERITPTKGGQNNG